MRRSSKKTKSLLSEAMRRMRIALNYTQTEFAARLGVSLRSIAAYEQGDRRPGKYPLSQLLEIAKERGWSQYTTVFDDALRWRKPLRRPSRIDPPIHGELNVTINDQRNIEIHLEREQAWTGIVTLSRRQATNLARVLAKAVEAAKE